MNEQDGIGSAADLEAAATRFTGLADFGTGDYRDGLTVLLESYARDAGLTALGAKVTRAMLRGALMARLLSEAGWARYPEHAEVGIERPIFVTGLRWQGAGEAQPCLAQCGHLPGTALLAQHLPDRKSTRLNSSH